MGSWLNLLDEHEERWEAVWRACRLPRLVWCYRSLALTRACGPAPLANATLLLASCGPTLPDSKPLDYDEALDTFQVMEGFRIELTAAGPYVLEPVEINRLSLAPSRHRF